jgi:hypothetical protein
LLAHGRCFSPGTPASSTTKTGRHDIAEILLKVALKHQKSNQIKTSSANFSSQNLPKLHEHHIKLKTAHPPSIFRKVHEKLQSFLIAQKLGCSGRISTVPAAHVAPVELLY